jgi:flagellar L-ring protein FlgH
MEYMTEMGLHMWKSSSFISLFMFSVYLYAADIDKYQPLVSDAKSYSAGASIVIFVVEAATAEASAGTGVGRKTDIGVKAHNTSNAIDAGIGVDGSDGGNGKTSRKGKVTTQLSATVTEVLPDGMLRIKGAQSITINGEKQSITVAGLIRIKDISKNNSIFSYQISDAMLEISGIGDVSQSQKQNIFYRVFNWLGIL